MEEKLINKSLRDELEIPVLEALEDVCKKASGKIKVFSHLILMSSSV
jgi:hypothetical protein